MKKLKIWNDLVTMAQPRRNTVVREKSHSCISEENNPANDTVGMKSAINCKRIFIIFITISLLFGSNCFAFNVHASDCSAEYGIKYYESKKDFKKTKYDKQILKDKKTATPKLKKGCVVVTIKTMCDKAYQKIHKKDWKVRAKMITVKATEKLYSKFNIHYIVKKGVAYKSANSQDAYTLLKKFTSKYKPGKKADMIVALSGKNPQHIAGITYMGQISGGARVLVFASTFEAEAETVQHEIGHTYNLNHCNRSCVMTGEGFGYINKFCPDHKKQWKTNRTYYKTKVRK